MEDIINKATVLAEKCASELDLKIISVDYVLENGIKILRIIGEGQDGLSIDEASSLNELISTKLDEEDFIDEEYYLEVSSEGLEKELRNDEDIFKAVGKYVCIKTYEKIDGLKEIYGDLVSFIDDILTINYQIKSKKKVLEIHRSKISKIRLAVKF